MLRNGYFFLMLLCFCIETSKAQQTFQFAFLTDTHVGSTTGMEDLRRSVKDINANPNIKFVIHTGDVTEFGSDAEIMSAKQLMDSLRMPYYIIPGNHDANWSESGSNTFKRVFGKETIDFNYGGYLFLGTGSGPNLRMGPGQIPRENIIWLDSVLNTKEATHLPIIFLNHYPMTADLNNWYEAIDTLKKKDIRIILHGHGHIDKQYSYDGIPAVMCRSNLRATKDTGAYNIVTVRNDTMFFQDKKPYAPANTVWASVPLQDLRLGRDTTIYPRPSYSVNGQYTSVQKVWKVVQRSDVGSGLSLQKDALFITNTAGELKCLNASSGKENWSFASNGKVYSTPYYSKGIVVFASTDHNIYAVTAKTGKMLWRYQTNKPSVACPLVKNGVVYVGGGDGYFRALSLKTGKLLWAFSGVTGFVVDQPLYYQGRIYFGCWNNRFYALNAHTGKLEWEWNNGHTNRMLSPAACWPVATHGRVYIVSPDRVMTALDAATGKVVWQMNDPKIRVRESMGLSNDGKMVYVKTMDGELLGISTISNSFNIMWIPRFKIPYDICPTAIKEDNGLVFIPTNSGLLLAVSRKTSKIAWEYKISNSLVTGITPGSKKRVYVSTMDGNIALLQYQ